MTRSPRERAIYALSRLLAAAPFAVGLLRAAGSRRDPRFLGMAFAAFVGGALVMMLGRAWMGKTYAIPMLSVAAWIVGAAFAAATAFRLGATAAPGVWAVAIVFGLCCSAAFALSAMSRIR